MYNNCEMCFVSHRVAGQVCLGGTKILNKFNSIQFNITFTSVFSTTHISLSIDFTSALAEVSSPTQQSLDRPLGARPWKSDHAITPSNGSHHYGGPLQWGNNIQGGPEGQVFPGSSHMQWPLVHSVAPTCTLDIQIKFVSRQSKAILNQGAILLYCQIWGICSDHESTTCYFIGKEEGCLPPWVSGISLVHSYINKAQRSALDLN